MTSALRTTKLDSLVTSILLVSAVNFLVSPSPAHQATNENAFLNGKFPQNHRLKKNLNLSDVRLSTFQDRCLPAFFGKAPDFNLLKFFLHKFQAKFNMT